MAQLTRGAGEALDQLRAELRAIRAALNEARTYNRDRMPDVVEDTIRDADVALDRAERRVREVVEPLLIRQERKRAEVAAAAEREVAERLADLERRVRELEDGRRERPRLRLVRRGRA